MTSQYFGGTISGGATPGYLSLENYHEGVLSREKALLIRNIASDLQKVLKFSDKNVNVETADIGKVISVLRDNIPNPKKNQTLSKDVNVQKHVCTEIAKAINTRMGSVVVDTSATPEAICQSVSEIMNTLFVNVQSEFLSVASDIKRVLGNLALLRRSLEQSFEKLKQAVDEGTDDTTKLKSGSIAHIYHDLIHEIDRQMTILGNLVNVTIDPSTRTIADLTERDKDFKGFVRSLQSEYGTADLSKKLTYVIANVEGVAQLAGRIDEVLKQVGMTVADYKNSKNTAELVNKVHAHFEQNKKAPTTTDVAKLIAAINIIRDTDYQHGDIVKHLEDQAQAIKKRGGAGYSGEQSLEKRLDRQRTVRDSLFRDFETRLEQQYRQIMTSIDVMAKRIGTQGGLPLDDHLQRFVKTFSDLDDGRGGVDRERFYLALSGYQQDPVSKEERQRFLGRLDAVSRSIVPLLSGPSGEHFRSIKMAVDAVIETIDKFTDTYLRPITRIDPKPATGGDVDPKYERYRDCETYKKDEEEDDFGLPGDDGNDKEDDKEDDKEHQAEQKYDKSKKSDSEELPNDSELIEPEEGTTFDSAVSTAESTPSSSGYNSDNEEEEKSGSGVSGGKRKKSKKSKKSKKRGGGFADGNSAFVTLSQAIRHLKFYYNTAKVKHNLSAAAADIKTYSKDYEVILGDAIGSQIIAIKKKYEAFRNKIDVNNPNKKADAELLDMWIKTNVNVVDPTTGASISGNTVEENRAWRQSVKDNALKFAKEAMNVQIDLLKTVEAVDLYLMNFANAIANNADEIKELDQLLKTVTIVAKWFTDRSGNAICDLFETAPSALYGNQEVHVDSASAYPQNHEDHYYDWVAGLIKPESKVHAPANPFLGVLPHKTDDDESVYDILIEKAKKATLSVRVLDNIVSTFARLGSQYGTTNINDKSFMPPAVIFKNLRKYMYTASLVMGMESETEGNREYIPDNSPLTARSAIAETSVRITPTADDFSHSRNSNILVGTDGYRASPVKSAATILAAYNDIDATRWVRNHFGIAFSSICDDTEKPANGFNDCWKTTDNFFIKTIKSMICKVFTVLGTRSVLNQPLEKYTSLSTVRFILGGDYSVPEIIPGAIELYLRLPLLAEFYRELFDFTDNNNSHPISTKDGRRITMVPEFDGVWENFVRIIFEDARYVEQGTYSETHVKALIREINTIYNRYKTAGDATVVQDVISEFVKEVNRRYGIIKQKDIDKYYKDKRRYNPVPPDAYNPVERLEYNILDEKNINGRRPAPSDRYDHMFAADTDRKIENPWDDEYQKLVYDFRNKLDCDIMKLNKKPKISFDQTVRQYKMQVEHAKTNDEKYRVVLKAMQGVDQLNTVSQHKVLMFHELILAPLHTLYSIWTVMNQFVRRVRTMDIVEIEKIVEAQVGSNALSYNSLEAELRGAGMNYERYIHPGFRPNVNLTEATEQTEIPSFERASGYANANILVYKGTYAARTDVTWGDVAAIAATTTLSSAEKKRAVEGAKRFTIDRNTLFKDLMNITFALTGDLGDMISVKIQQQNMVVEYSNLADHCTQLMNSVKKNLEMFRGVIDDSVISRIEGGEPSSSTGRPSRTGVGSLYWIEECLIEKIFKNTRNDRSLDNTGIIHTNEILGRTFRKLCTSWTVTANMVGGTFAEPTYLNRSEDRNLPANDRALLEHEKAACYDSYDCAMSQLVYWEPIPVSTTNSSALGRKITHALKRPSVKNNVDSWPFAVIPTLQNTHSEDSDMKELKATQDVMKQLIIEILTTMGAITRAPGSAPTSPIVWRNVAGAQVSPFVVYGVGAIVRYRDVVDNLAIEAVPTHSSVTTLTPATQTRVVELMNRFNALAKQRERIYRSAIRTPVDERVKWYTDSSKEEGAWFLNQLSPEEAYTGSDPAEDKGVEFDTGLLMRLNEIIAKYLYCGWDTASKRMYSGLINKFANSSHVAAVSRGEAINDVSDVFGRLSGSFESTGIIGVPQKHVVLFASIARAMRNILINTKRSGDPEYKTDSMMEIPIHMKETLRANLPGFDKLFKLVLKKAEFLRQASQQITLTRQVPYLIKYGINRVKGSASVPNGIHTAPLPAPQPWGNVKNSQANAALLEPNDVMYVPTGFVIRNATREIIDAVKKVIQTEQSERYISNPLLPVPAGDVTWIHGAPDKQVGPYYFKKAGERHGAWENTVCDTNMDLPTYTRFAAYDDLSRDAAKRWFTDTLDDISNAATSISKCCMETYKELADEPKYLETHEGFITDYINMNKREPIMLLSQLQIALRQRFRDLTTAPNANGGEYDVGTHSGYAAANYMLPLYKSGETAFKLTYGSRLIVGRPDVKPGMEYMPGMTGLLERYNGVSTNDLRVDKTAFDTFAVNHACLLRYIIDLRFFRAVLDTGSGGRLWRARTSIAPPRGGAVVEVDTGSALFDAPLYIAPIAKTSGSMPTDEYDYSKKLRSYPSVSSLEQVISITESSDQDSTMRDIIESLHARDTQIDSRASARIYNIIDLDIVPINPAALMREIPLINILNYSYTYDRQIQDMLLPDVQGATPDERGCLIKSDYKPNSASGMLAKFLIYPLSKLSDEEYYGYFARIITGDSGMDIGRPKFLSDQLWNKALFQELYTQPIRANDRGRRHPDESGPAADNAQRRVLYQFRDHPEYLMDALVPIRGAAGLAALRAMFPIIPSPTAAQIQRTITQFRASIARITTSLQPLSANLDTNAVVVAAFQALSPLIANTGGSSFSDLLKETPQYRRIYDRIFEIKQRRRAALPNVNEQNEVLDTAFTMLAIVMIEEHLKIAHGSEPVRFENNGQLQYPKRNGKDGAEVGVVSFTDNDVKSSGVNIRHDLGLIGRLRADTTLVRFFLHQTFSQLMMRIMMRKEINDLDSPVVSSSSVLSRQITEYESNETFDAEVFQQ